MLRLSTVKSWFIFLTSTPPSQFLSLSFPIFNFYRLPTKVRKDNVLVVVYQSFKRGGGYRRWGVFRVTITHNALDFTVQGLNKAPDPLDMGPHCTGTTTLPYIGHVQNLFIIKYVRLARHLLVRYLISTLTRRRSTLDTPINYDPPMKLWEGKVFTGICLSMGGGSGGGRSLWSQVGVGMWG